MVSAASYQSKQTAPQFTITEANGITTAALQLQPLSDDQVHFFFPAQPPTEELHIASLLEKNLFPPSNPAKNKLYDIDRITILPDIEYNWCRFPKEYKPAAISIAALFGLVTTDKGRKITVINKGVLHQAIHFPSSPKTLYFKGTRCQIDELDEKEAKAQQFLDQVAMICHTLAHITLSAK